MTAAVEQNQQKPWEKEQLPFNNWYRKKLQADFGAVLNMVNLTRDIIRNGEDKGEMYQTLLANLQESQSRLTQLLFELEERDMELALKINDSICATLDWAKKSEVSSLLPEIISTKDVSKFVVEMLDKKAQLESTDEKKMGDGVDIELKVGVGPTAQIRCMRVPKGSTLTDLKNTISNLKKRKHVTFVRQGLKVEETTVLLNGDNIIAVVASTEGPFEGFDEPEEKTLTIQPISPPPDSKKKAQEITNETNDLITPAVNQETSVADPFDFLNINTDTAEPAVKPVEGEHIITMEAGSNEKETSNPFDPLSEEPKAIFDILQEESKPAASANPFEGFESTEEAPLITFDRFLVGDSNEANEEVKETTEKDNLLGDNSQSQDGGNLEKQDTFPKFAGFS